MWLSEFTAAKVLSYYNSQLPTSVATFIVTHCLTLSHQKCLQKHTETSNVSELECKEAIWNLKVSVEWVTTSPLLFFFFYPPPAVPPVPLPVPLPSPCSSRKRFLNASSWSRSLGVCCSLLAPCSQSLCRWTSPHAQAISAAAGLRVSWMYSWNKTRKRQ